MAMLAQPDVPIDPATGLPYMDEAVDPLSMPGVAPVVNAAGVAGAAPAQSGQTIQVPEGGSLFPAPPAHETQSSVSRTVPTAAEGVTQQAVAAANQKEIGAIRAEGEVDQLEANAEIARADQVATVKAANAERERLAAEASEKRLQERIAEEKKLGIEAGKAGIAAGDAKANYWSGNPVGQVLAALVQSVAAGEQARVGRDGMSPAERIITGKINDYEKQMISRWELTKEARDLKLKDRPAFDAREAQIKAEAARHSQRDLEVANAAWDRVIKGYGPQKAAALTAAKEAAAAKGQALIDQKSAEGLREVHKFDETTRTAAPGAEDKRGFAAREDIESVVGAEADIDALEKLKKDAIENPEAYRHVVDVRARYAEMDRKRDIAKGVPFGIGSGAMALAALENSDLTKTSPDQLLDAKKFPKAPDIYSGVENANAAKARTYGGVIQEGDRKAAEAASAMSSRGPKEYAEYIDKLIAIRRKQLDGMVGAKKGLGSFASPDKAREIKVTQLDPGSLEGMTDAQLALALRQSVESKDGRAAEITQEIARRTRAKKGN